MARIKLPPGYRVKIVTNHEYPPIPLRQFDWSACTDNYEPGAPLEHGETETEAVDNLLKHWCKNQGADVSGTGECLLCPASSGEICRIILP